MIWSVVIPTMMVSLVAQRWGWSKWGLRVSVVSSLVANLVLGLLSGTRRLSACCLLSGTRRRSASCLLSNTRRRRRWASICHLVLVFVVWFAYQIADISTKSAIGSLSLCSSDATEDEQQLVAFWAPFLLLYLGGPDNLTAYSLEDSKLSPRTAFDMGLNFGVVFYTVYNYIYHGHSSRLLFAASVIVCVSGVTRYFERVYALWKTSLDTMQQEGVSSSSLSSSSSSWSSSWKEKTSCEETAWEKEKMGELRCRIMRMREKQLGDGEALLLAQDLFPIWRRAMVDSSVKPKSKRQLASNEIICSLEWNTMCQVAEMELSLMYEVLYTKAIMAHTWPGYLIRFMSPLASAAAALLFWFHRHGGSGGTTTTTSSRSFVWITYALLGIAFIQDVAWLLRALGSTWTYGYLQGEQTPPLLRHRVLHTGKIRWCDIHRIVVRLDPLRLLLGVDPVSYRRWSGTIGQYNLLGECTTGQQCPEWLVSIAGDKIKEIPYLYKLPKCAKKLQFQRVKKILMEAIRDEEDKEKRYTMVDIRTCWGEKAFKLRNNKLFRGLDSGGKSAPKFGKEFEEDVLLWHIATCIVLPCIRHEAGILSPKSQAHAEAHADAIAVMSEYMMFHVAVRREMLPGLVLHSQLDATQEALAGLWKDKAVLLSDKDKKAAADDKEKLAMILKRIRNKKKGKDEDIIKNKWKKLTGGEGTILLADAVELYCSLQLAGETPGVRCIREARGQNKGKKVPKRDRRPPPAAELLEFIFNVWVDKLVYASVRCSRESHAKQLSFGGDLTTVLWMVIQHAGPFRMGEDKHPYIKLPQKAKPPPPPSYVYPYPYPCSYPYPYPYPSCPPVCHSDPPYDISGDESDTAITLEEATEEEDEDYSSDDEYTPPIEYITVY